MGLEKKLDDILNTKSKIKIIRFFISRRSDFLASGNDVARAIGFTPPAVHASLKELYDQDILRRDIVGKQHIYRLNTSSRIVKEILKPAFQKERSIKEDIKNFLLKKISDYKAKRIIKSMILYGSIVLGRASATSDCDIAVVASNAVAKNKLERLFIEKISPEFAEYFGISLDPYVKTFDEFKVRIERNLSPASTLMKSYEVVYGKDPIHYR